VVVEDYKKNFDECLVQNLRHVLLLLFTKINSETMIASTISNIIV